MIPAPRPTPVKILSLLALSSIAILACSFCVAPANALFVDSHHVHRRHHARGHDELVLNKRSNSTRRCKPRNTSTTSSSTSSTTPTNTPAKVIPQSIPTSSSTTTTSHTPAATPVSHSGGKVGLAWAGDDADLAKFKTGRVSSVYNWSPSKPSHADQLNLPFIPMLWCDDQIADFTRLVKQGYATAVLGPNEPNQPGQCNISPQHGAQLWKKYIDPLRFQGYKLYTPAVTSNPNGKTWMKDFFAACDGCHFDALALHWYDVGAEKLIAYVTDFHNTFNMDIIVTEFACQNFNGGAQCTQPEIFTFMTKVVEFFDTTSWIIGYYPFGFMHDLQGVNPLDSLMKSDGEPTDLGWLVINGP